MTSKPCRILALLTLAALLLTACGRLPKQETEPSAPAEAQPAAPETVPEPLPEPEPQSAPEPEPAPDEPDPMDARVQERLGAMTTEQKIAQLFFVSPEALTGSGGAVTVAGDATREAFSQRPVGGVIYSYDNLTDPEQTRAMLTGMQQISRDVLELPVFLGVDEEGGTVARVSGREEFGVEAWPDMAEVSDEAEARRIGEAMGGYLRDLGFNLDFAPVADVLSNPENTVVRVRAFSQDPETVTAMCAAFSDGLQSGGVMACYKHFPGHGGTAEDSHEGFAQSPHAPEEFTVLDLPPFSDAAGREIPFIMVGHITFPEVTREETPASLSREIVTELLRDELGFRGVAITDSLDMGAITQNYPAGEAAVQAVLAGEDMLLISDGFAEAYDAVTAAVADGTIPGERLDEAVGRILRVKLAWEAEQ